MHTQMGMGIPCTPPRSSNAKRAASRAAKSALRDLMLFEDERKEPRLQSCLKEFHSEGGGQFKSWQT